jgi:hypothetical protein
MPWLPRRQCSHLHAVDARAWHPRKGLKQPPLCLLWCSYGCSRLRNCPTASATQPSWGVSSLSTGSVGMPGSHLLPLMLLASC